MSETGQDPTIKGSAIEHETQRRMLAREAIQRGRLPGRLADHIWGGKGAGEACSVCSLPIPAQEVGYELEFDQNGQGPTCRYLHIRCFAAWEFTCRNGNTGDFEETHDEESPDLLKLNGHQHEPGQ